MTVNTTVAATRGAIGRRRRVALVATEGGCRVFQAQTSPKPIGKRYQQTVASLVAEAVVDQLEVVQIDKQNGDALRLAVGPSKSSLQTIGQEGAIGQASERIVERHLLQLAFECLALGDVAAGHDDTGYRWLIEEIVGDHLEVSPRAVGVT